MSVLQPKSYNRLRTYYIAGELATTGVVSYSIGNSMTTTLIVMGLVLGAELAIGMTEITSGSALSQFLIGRIASQF